MATLIFRLRNVPDDEAQAVREILDDSKIDWYETTAGNWGIAMPGIWVAEDHDAAQARSLINQYQEKRQSEVRIAYEEGLATGETKTLFQTLKAHPLKTLLIVLFCVFIVYVSVNPFLQLIGLTAKQVNDI